MQISNRFSPVAEKISKLPQAKIAMVIGIILLGYIAYLFAQITWLVLDEPANHNSVVITQSGSKGKNNTSSVNVSDIRALNLFGVYNESPVVRDEPEEIEDAPETNLNLTLTGVVASNEEAKSAAIIEHNSTQEIYAIDETIKGTRAVLKKVFQDRVHIRHSGRLETLMLDGFDYQETQSSNQAPKKVAKKIPLKTTSSKDRFNPVKNPIRVNHQPRMIDQRLNKELSKQAQDFKNDIASDPGKITDYLKIAPKRVDGSIIGYRLMPGRNPEFFKSAGLKSGDVAIQMNGLDLSQPAEAAQALKALREERDVSLLLDRDGDITEILFSIDE